MEFITVLAFLLLLANPVPAASATHAGVAESAGIPLSGLQLWLKADAGIETGPSAEVRRWKDQSGNGNDAVSESDLGPTFVSAGLLGHPSVRFNATNTFLRVAHDDALNAGREMSLFAVYRLGGHGRLAQKGDGGGTQGSAWFLDTNGLGVAGRFYRDVVFPPGDVYVQSNIFDVSSGTLRLYSNGALVGSVFDVTTQVPNRSDLFIGKRNIPGGPSGYANNGQAYFGGDLAELLIYNRALSDTERRMVEAYLTAKYSVEELKPIPVGLDGGRGPLAAGLTTHPIGVANVFGSEQPDLFIFAGASSTETGLFLYEWKGTGSNGEPFFEKRYRVMIEGVGNSGKGTVFQTDDGVIHGVWILEKELFHTIYDRDRRAFVRTNRVPWVPESTPWSGYPAFVGSQIALLPNEDGGFEVIGAISDGVRSNPEGDWRSADYRPYDAAGLWRGGVSYGTLYGVQLPSLSESPKNLGTRVSLTDREALLGFTGLTQVNLGPGRERDMIGTNRFGNLIYYHNRVPQGVSLEERRLAVDTVGVALRHPVYTSTVVAYPNLRTGLSDLIVGGEGALYYYEFQGEFTQKGAPVYKEPVPVLAENTFLYPGSLPVTSVADWDGDGVFDIVAGNSEGRVLFFKNVGTEEAPSFLPGEPIQAGGWDIHIQAEYGGSIQGPGEARWGYASPTVVDWNGDGLLDIVMSDITGRHTVYLNRGTHTYPVLELGRPLYMDGLELRGTWRTQPGAARVGDRMAYVTLDADDELHLYWQVDAYNLEDGGKLTLDDGSVMRANFWYAGGTGRLKLVLDDWDLDGKLDLIIGTPRHGSVPDPEFGLPQALGLPGAAVLFLKNIGTNERPLFQYPRLIAFRGEPIYLGQHASSPALVHRGNQNGPDLIVGDQDGKFWYYTRDELSVVDVLFVKVEQPKTSSTVRGVITPQLTVVPSYADVARVVYQIGTSTIYEGDFVPNEVTIDTRTLSDGPHTLYVRVFDSSGNRAQHSVNFYVDNRHVLVDELQPPINNPLLGQIDRTKTHQVSPGWAFAAGDPAEFHGDSDRVILTNEGAGYLIWQVPNLESFAVTLYVRRSGTPGIPSLSASGDGQTWKELTYRTEESSDLTSDWVQVKLVGHPPFGQGWYYFKLTLETEPGAAQDVQVGGVELIGRDLP